MPGVGGLSIATNLLANAVTLNLNLNQDRLQTVVTQLSSGLRINTAADDPSGLAIATRLNAQASAFDQASYNVQDANNAVTVADGALQTETNILTRIRDLAVEAASDVTSDNDKLSLQSEVSQLLLEINRISQSTNFNGQYLLSGIHEGFTPQINFNAVIYSNSVLGQAITVGQSNTLVNSVTYQATNNSSIDGTLELQVAQLSATQQGVIFSFLCTSTNGYSEVCIATVDTAGDYISFFWDGVTVTTGACIGTVDVGVTSYVKITQYVSASSNSSNPAFTIQDGADEGSVIAIGIQATNTQTLRLSNLNVAGTIGTGNGTIAAEDAIGQIDYALNQLLNQRALLGAVVNRLNEDEDNNNIASVNLTAAASNITDLNVAQATTEFTKLQILVQVGTSVLAQANSNAQSVVSLFR
ncbi:MAG TPA: flagellin [Candidatus Acidoferrales bacterium]|nr:flagellin [Candidatus Acidoferrales bacterium]